jgi:hypothetical protein
MDLDLDEMRNVAKRRELSNEAQIDLEIILSECPMERRYAKKIENVMRILKDLCL